MEELGFVGTFFYFRYCLFEFDTRGRKGKPKRNESGTSFGIGVESRVFGFQNCFELFGQGDDMAKKIGTIVWDSASNKGNGGPAFKEDGEDKENVAIPQNFWKKVKTSWRVSVKTNGAGFKWNSLSRIH